MVGQTSKVDKNMHGTNIVYTMTEAKCSALLLMIVSSHSVHEEVKKITYTERIQLHKCNIPRKVLLGEK